MRGRANGRIGWVLLGLIAMACVGGFPGRSAAFFFDDGLPTTDPSLNPIGATVPVGTHDGYTSGHSVGTYYTLPSGGTPVKAIVVIHGGDAEGCIPGQTSCDETMSWAAAWFARRMIDRGYLVISTDYHGDYEHSVYADLQAVVAYYLSKFPKLQKAKIALFGGSHGALNVSRVLWFTPGLQAGMAVSGEFDMVDLWNFILKEAGPVVRRIQEPKFREGFSRPGNCGPPDPGTPCEEHWRKYSPAYVRAPQISDCNVQDGACAALAQRPLFLAASDSEYQAIQRETFALCGGLKRRSSQAVVADYRVHNLPHGFMGYASAQAEQLLSKYLDFLDHPQGTPCGTPLQ
jgi:hypothetical protein